MSELQITQNIQKETLIKRAIGYLGGLIATFVLVMALLHGYLKLSNTSYWILWQSTGTMMPIGYETVEVKDRGFEDYIVERTLKYDREKYSTLVDRIEETGLYQLDTAKTDEISVIRENKALGYWTETENGQKFVDSTLIGGVGLNEMRIRVQLVDSTRTLHFKKAAY